MAAQAGAHQGWTQAVTESWAVIVWIGYVTGFFSVPLVVMMFHRWKGRKRHRTMWGYAPEWVQWLHVFWTVGRMSDERFRKYYWDVKEPTAWMRQNRWYGTLLWIVERERLRRIGRMSVYD